MSYIGIFDSGIGGLTVVRSIIELLPNENIIYFGDTKNCPYGIKGKDEIIRLALEDAKFLNTFDLKALVIACNTADSVASKSIKEAFDLPVYGVVSPASKKAAQETKNNKIGVIATGATINSESYLREISNTNKDAEIIQVACPKLVPLVEAGKFTKDYPETIEAVHEYLDPLKEKGIDTLVLGCTHYPLLLDLIKEIMPNTNIISSSEAIAKEIKKSLIDKNLLENNESPIREYYVSDDPEGVTKLVNMFMPNEVKEIKLKK